MALPRGFQLSNTRTARSSLVLLVHLCLRVCTQVPRLPLGRVRVRVRVCFRARVRVRLKRCVCDVLITLTLCCALSHARSSVLQCLRCSRPVNGSERTRYALHRRTVHVHCGMHAFVYTHYLLECILVHALYLYTYLYAPAFSTRMHSTAQGVERRRAVIDVSTLSTRCAPLN